MVKVAYEDRVRDASEAIKEGEPRGGKSSHLPPSATIPAGSYGTDRPDVINHRPGGFPRADLLECLLLPRFNSYVTPFPTRVVSWLVETPYWVVGVTVVQSIPVRGLVDGTFSLHVTWRRVPLDPPCIYPQRTTLSSRDCAGHIRNRNTVRSLG
jgi:hypothetical protein